MVLETSSRYPFQIKNVGIKGIKCKTLALENVETFYKLHIQHRKGCPTYVGSCCVCNSKMTYSRNKIHQLPVRNELTSCNQHAKCNLNLIQCPYHQHAR